VHSPLALKSISLCMSLLSAKYQDENNIMVNLKFESQQKTSQGLPSSFYFYNLIFISFWRVGEREIRETAILKDLCICTTTAPQKCVSVFVKEVLNRSVHNRIYTKIHL